MFFDTEFTGLKKNTTLVSIGIVAENGKNFYAEFTDYDAKQVDKWVKENVIDNLLLDGMGDGVSETDENPSCVLVRGNKEYVKDELVEWISQFDSVQFISDVCHYDFVLLIDIFGTAFDLPENVSASCHDINQDIARVLRISDKEAFDLSREELLTKLGKPLPKGVKHNALYDAKVIKELYQAIA